MTTEKYFIKQILDHVSSGDRKSREKTSFWPSESESMLFDIYHRWIGTTPTNPIEPEKLLMMMVGKKVEEALVETMLDMGAIQKEEDGQHRVDMERQGVRVTGYIDALTTDGIPIEIKSYYGDYQDRELKAGKPKSNYLKQLAMYMDFLDKDMGKLIYVNRGTGEPYEFTLTRKGSKYKCMAIEFDLNDTYLRWARLYEDHVKPKIEPVPDYRYKIPVDEVDWKAQGKSNISKARNGHKVIGDHPFAVAYSDFKDLILEKQGVTPGYTDAEKARIVELTQGYSNWYKKTTKKT